MTDFALMLDLMIVKIFSYKPYWLWNVDFLWRGWCRYGQRSIGKREDNTLIVQYILRAVYVYAFSFSSINRLYSGMVCVVRSPKTWPTIWNLWVHGQNSVNLLREFWQFVVLSYWRRTFSFLVPHTLYLRVSCCRDMPD